MNSCALSSEGFVQGEIELNHFDVCVWGDELRAFNKNCQRSRTADIGETPNALANIAQPSSLTARDAQLRVAPVERARRCVRQRSRTGQLEDSR